MSMYDPVWLQKQITALIARIENFEAAVDALATNTILQYTLDTGQSRQVVTKQDVVRLNAALDSMYNKLATLEQRRNACGTRHGVPAW